MQEGLNHAAASIFCSPEELWVLVNEHQIHSRIPDLVVARIDPEALQQRLLGGWGRALGPTELRAFRALRPDRGRTLGSVARQVGVGEGRAREILSRLVADSFVECTLAGSYARRAPVRPILDRVISIEAKRSDLIGAFSQARANSAFADVSLVAFDSVYRHRAEAIQQAYAREGIGLLALSASDGSWEYLQRPRRSALIAALGRALTAERTLSRLLGVALKQLPQTRLPGGFHANVRPAAPRLLGPAPKGLLHSLPGCGLPPRDSAHG